MENTKNKFPKHLQVFFKELSDYLDTQLLFYGSIQRSDYFPGQSDIDVDIFTDNEQAIIAKLQHFLHVNKNEFKKTVWVMNDVSGYGYKLKYENNIKQINVEFSIYNEKFREPMLEQHITKTMLPLYINIILYILKFSYYKLCIVPEGIYIYIKKFLLNDAIGRGNDLFVITGDLN